MSVDPPRPKGPPLNALRAFEAAARLASFTAAAEELSVTPGAVSQHIRTLEGWTGAPLFARTANGVALTAEGRRLQPAFTAAFDALGRAVRGLRDLSPRREAHLATMPALAQIWLPPRLRRIRAELPDLDLAVTALEAPPNLAREMFDLSLFIRRPTGVAEERILAQDAIFPVAAPDLAKEIRTPEDLNRAPLLIDQAWAEDWPLWARAAGVEFDPKGRVAHHSLYSLALDEAQAGAGVLMGHAALVAEAVATGALRQLFSGAHRTGKALVLEAPAGGAASDIAAVADLLAETAAPLFERRASA